MEPSLAEEVAAMGVMTLLLPWILVVAFFASATVGLRLVCAGEPPAALRRLADRWSRSRRTRRQAPADVFDTLHVQSRLGAVADEILRLECDPQVFARAARLQATHRAYDDLLAQACRLADIPLVPDPRRPDDVRATAELELASRGWSW